MKIKNAIFDWDGTLAETSSFLAKSMQEAIFEVTDIKYDISEVKRFLGKQSKEVFDGFNKTQREAVKALYYEKVKTNHLTELKVFNEAEDILQKSNDRFDNVYLLSNKTENFLLKEVEHLGWSKYFKNIVGGANSEYDKPHKSAFENVSSNINPLETVVIGDGESDIKIAKNVGAKSVLVGNVDLKDELNPDYCILELKNLFDVLDG